MAYLGFTNLRDAERITLVEYQLRLEAYELQTITKREDQAMQAWYNYAVQSTTGGSKPKWAFNSPNKFLKAVEIERLKSEFFERYGLDRGRKADNMAKAFQRRYDEFHRLKQRGLIDMNAWKGGG